MNPFMRHLVPRVVKFRDRKENGGCQGTRLEGMGSYYLMHQKFLSSKMKRILEMYSGDGRTSQQHLKPLNYILQNECRWKICVDFTTIF